MTNSYSSINIGTSGIVLPVSKSGYPFEFQAATRLQYYSSIFNSLELNSSFYKLPMPKTFAKWEKEVNENFSFTVKLSKSVTHAHDLQFNNADLETFMNSVNQLDKTRGSILIQFPPSITINYFSKVEAILQHLTHLQQQPYWKLAIEFRHASWYNSNTYNLLSQFHASMVFHDMPGVKTPMDHTATDIIYLRLHGPSGDYTGSYTESKIKGYAQWVSQYHSLGKSIFIYFNNTIGSAYNNARSLQQFLNKPKMRGYENDRHS